MKHFASPSKRRSWLLLLGLAVLVALLAAVRFAAAAQTYSFSVPELRMQVFVQPDASARIIYDITFENHSFAQAIDIVDIGTPHRNYDLGNFSASIDGVPLSIIRVSEFVDPGVEIHLLDRSIEGGESGTLHVEFTMPDMVYQDTTDQGLASLQITPTWFEGEFLSGTGVIWVLVHMLPEVDPDQVLYQDVPFTDKVLFEEHTVAVWRWDNAPATRAYPVGVSFPHVGMDRVVTMSLLDLTLKWLEDNPMVRLGLGAATVLLVALAFFRFSGGTGLTVFALLACGVIYVLGQNALWQLVALPVALALVGLNEYHLSKRKPRYLPAIAQVEGGGIKRGLTAPEAAVLLELPLNKVLMLIVFGLLEKGVVKAESHDPLRVRLAPEYATEGTDPAERRRQRTKVAQSLGAVLRAYEHPFLDIIEPGPDEPLHKLNFSAPMKSLIGHTAERVKGFDLSDTQDYYRKIIARAMKEAQSIGEIPERERFLDRNLQWLLMDDAYPTVFTARDYRYRPIWVRPFASSDRLAGSVGGGVAAARPSTPSAGGKTSFGDVAASFAGWTENTMGKLANTITPGSLQVRSGSGMVNLKGVDRVTGDIFKELAKSSSSGSRSGGGGGGCACACAGCACACACAGGGR
jgi:hypothetical protein